MIRGGDFYAVWIEEFGLWSTDEQDALNLIDKILDEKSTKVGVLATKDEDIRSLRELIIYGLKGMSAYMKHANALGYNDEEIKEDFLCPLCGVNKEYFEEIKKSDIICELCLEM